MLLWAFLAICGFCIIGEIVTNRFDMFNETLCNTNWYFFPIKLQQMLAIFMTITQQSATIHGSGSIVCRREAFKKVKLTEIQHSHWFGFVFVIENSSIDM